MIEIISDNDRKFLIEQIKKYLEDTQWLVKYFKYDPKLFCRLKEDHCQGDYKYLKFCNKNSQYYYIAERMTPKSFSGRVVLQLDIEDEGCFGDLVIKSPNSMFKYLNKLSSLESKEDIKNMIEELNYNKIIQHD